MSAERGRHRVFGTTADLGIAVVARDLDGLFSVAGEGLASVLCDRRRVRPAESRRVSLRAESVESLLVAWLDELVYLFDGKGFLVRDVEARHTPPGSLEALLRGEPYDPARHVMRTPVKAVTWHRLEVRRDGKLWRARVILDV